MARTKLPIGAWQDRLAENFTTKGVVGGSLLKLTGRESAAGHAFSQKYIGHRYLSDCSQSFAFDTLELTPPESVATAQRKLEGFPIVYLEFLMIFRRVRAAHIASINGYPGPAHVMLRDVKDRSIFLSAVFQEHVTYTELMGITKHEPKNLDTKALNEYRRRKRMRLEKHLIEKYLTANPEFDSETTFELKRWNDLFNWETHGSFLSQSNSMLAWVKGEAYPQLVETGVPDSDAMMMNRFNEATWLFHRLLPNLQHGNGFGEEWSQRWRVLDDSFWQMQESLGSMGKKIGRAFVTFIDKKFPFDETTRLPLAR